MPNNININSMARDFYNEHWVQQHGKSVGGTSSRKLKKAFESNDPDALIELFNKTRAFGLVGKKGVDAEEALFLSQLTRHVLTQARDRDNGLPAAQQKAIDDFTVYWESAADSYVRFTSEPAADIGRGIKQTTSRIADALKQPYNTKHMAQYIDTASIESPE